MDTNKNITIIREHDKIELLEQLLTNNGLKSIEIFVSNLIDFISIDNTKQINLTLALLQHHIIDPNILDLTLNISNSIAKQIPLVLTVEVNDTNIKYINYINNYPHILPLF